MKVRIERDKLADAVAWAMRGLSNSRFGGNTGVGIEAGVGTLTLLAFDRDTSAQADIDAAVDIPGSVLVPGRLLNDITKTLPPHPVQLSVNDGTLKVECGKSLFTIPLLTDNFPQMLEVPGFFGSVNGSTFAAAINQVATAAPASDKIPRTAGINLEFSKNTITLAATDMYKLAIRDIEWHTAVTDISAAAFVPVGKIVEIAKGLAECETVAISLANNQNNRLIGFSGNNQTIVTTLLNDRFLDYRNNNKLQIGEVSVYIESSVLSAAVRRVRLVLEDKMRSYIALTLGPNSIQLDAKGLSTGVASEKLDAVVSGSLEDSIKLDAFQITDGLSAIDSPWVKITLLSHKKPALLTAAKAANKDIDDGFKFWMTAKDL